MDSEPCILCPYININNPDGELTYGRALGMKTLIQSSLDRGDGLHEELMKISDEMLLDTSRTLKMHKKCRFSYIEKKRRNVAKNKRSASNSNNFVSSPAKRRSVAAKLAPEFSIKRDCFFCGRNQNNVRKSTENVLSDVRVIGTIDSVLHKIKERDDEWGRQVQMRISGFNDLIAPEAKYHRKCKSNFFMMKQNPAIKVSVEQTKGRPINEKISALFSQLCSYLESNDECQYTIDELENLIQEMKEDADVTFTRKTLKKKLKEYYGDQIVITSTLGRSDIVSFKGFTHDLLRKQWKHDKKDPWTDKEMLIDMAATQLSDEIRTMCVDQTTYPSFDTEGVKKLVPPLLLRFLKGLITTKSNNKEVVDRRILTIAHSIISAARVRSFVSPLLLAVTLYIHQLTASKQIIDALSSLGISESYTELCRVQNALSSQGSPSYDFSAFTGFIFDNADFQTATLTGHGTFHSLGGLMVCTPQVFRSPDALKRSLDVPKAINSRATCSLELLSYPKSNKGGLSSIDVDPIEWKFAQSIQFHSEDATKAFMLDLLWLNTFGRVLSPPITNWSGFMQVAVRGSNFDTSSIHTIPFIHATPSDMSTLYTALLFAEKQCKEHKIEMSPVTFDCPLYVKSAEIIAACKDEFKHIFARLGGFHWLMSAMGAIGYIMNGSGIEDLFSTVYARGSVPHLLTGHAYTRAFRAHLLASSALSSHLLADSSACSLDIKDALSSLLDKKIEVDQLIELEPIKTLVDKTKKIIVNNEEDCKTLKLWKSYLRMTHLVRLFLFAERTGNFKLHLYCMKHYLPYLHSAGHFNYARATRLYVQQMEELANKMTKETYDLYVVKGYYSVRRKNIFFSGISSDLVIEQDLMRLFKSSGGLTRGRGITDTTISWLVDILPKTIPISQFLEDFAGVYSRSSEQHKDLRPSCQEADIRDRGKFLHWFNDHSPNSFSHIDGLVNLESGVVGDPKVNCEDAYSIGMKSANAVSGKKFDFSLKRKDKVITLGSLSSTVKLRGEDTIVNPTILFHRFSLMINSDEEKEQFFSYELATEPPSLFKNSLMRKGNKADMGTILRKNVTSIDSHPKDSLFVIDGGWLLRRVKWNISCTFGDILDSYINYVKEKFGDNSIIIFDGYANEENSTKAHEHRLRSSKHMSPEIIFDHKTKVSLTTQEKFLANGKNKIRLIELLKQKFETEHIPVKQAEGDADPLIIRTSLNEVSKSNTPVVTIGNDTDLQVALTTLAKSNTKLFIQTDVEPSVVWKITDIQKQFKKNIRELLLFAYCFSGCDTTSSLFKKDKVKVMTTLQNLHAKELDQLLLFNKVNSDPAKLVEAGIMFGSRLYDEKNVNNDINKLRYNLYTKVIRNSKLSSNFQLESLPPTFEALKQHILRVYHSVQQFMGNYLEPTNWGWVKKNGTLYPFPTDKPIAPNKLLEMISCGCKSGCNKNCSCKKVLLHCSNMCKECHGRTCSNIPKEMDEESFN